MRSSRECLSCGQVRLAASATGDACPRCGYVGWAPPGVVAPAVRVQVRRGTPRPLRVRSSGLSL